MHAVRRNAAVLSGVARGPSGRAGATLGLLVGRPATGAGLILFHRGHEHSGRFADVVEALGLPDVAVFAWTPAATVGPRARAATCRASPPWCATSTSSPVTSVEAWPGPHRPGRARAQRRGRGGRGLGPQLRDADQGHGARDGGSAGKAVRAAGPPGAPPPPAPARPTAAAGPAADLRHELRPGPALDA
jgi:hypothetical protein